MKMKAEHYEALKHALDAISTQLAPMRVKYKAAGMSDMRFRWDALKHAHVSGNSTQWMCSQLYGYLNDGHIDTALRHYFGHSK